MKDLRRQVEVWLALENGDAPEYLWAKFPNHAVFRRKDNRKWYALVAEVSREKLGLAEKAPVPVLVVKCEPFLKDLLLEIPNYRPAYHMNKEHWITVLLDGSVPFEKIVEHLAMSRELAGGKK